MRARQQARGRRTTPRLRTRPAAGVIVAVLVGAVVGTGTIAGPPTPASVGLFQAAAGLDARGRLTSVPVGATEPFLAGSRVLAPVVTGGPAGQFAADRLAAERLAAGQRRWLAAGCVPGAGTSLEPMARAALLDLAVLSAPAGAAVASSHPSWRYVWPRDVSFVAAALARTGHPDDAVGQLQFLQAVQRPDGRFEARYSPEGRRAPDGRGIQLDGSGWVLWGLAMTVGALPDAERGDALRRLRPLLDQSVRAVDVAVAGGRRLPDPSPDYWERPEDEVTLGTVAPLLAGLHAAQRLYDLLGEDAAAAAAGAAADRLDGTVRAAFARHGYQRYPGGGGADAAVAMLLPPFAPQPRADVVRAFAAAAQAMLRPAGGLAPGARFRDDGYSWTPETALFGYVSAALGDVRTARGRISWLEAHRTAAGSLPEKVLADGRPASVAPLGWTAALVLLTLSERGVSVPDAGCS